MAEEEDKYTSDFTFIEGIDGTTIPINEPFYPEISYLFGEDDDGSQIETGFSIKFNQGYVYNRTSETNVQDTIKAQILNMEEPFQISDTGNARFFVEVVVDKDNFLVESATFTAIEGADIDKIGTDEGINTNFPHIIFNGLDDDIPDFTGYFPVCDVDGGAISRFYQRGDIVLSDRQFKQLGEAVADDSTSSTKVNGSSRILRDDGRKDETKPVRVRGVQGAGTVYVSETPDYVVVSGENVGAGVSSANIGSAVKVYEDGSSNPFEFRTLTGNGKPEDEGKNNTTVKIDPENANQILISGGHAKNLEGTAGQKVYVEDSIRPFKFRGIDVTGPNISISTVGAGSSSSILITHTEPTHDTPNLQEVTDEGSTTTNSISYQSASVGSATYRSTTPPSNGMFIEGQVGIGLNSFGGLSENLVVCGTQRIKDSTNNADGALFFGNQGSDGKLSFDHSEGQFTLGAGVSKLDSDYSGDFLEVFSEKSVSYSALNSYTTSTSPATGTAILAGSGNSISGHFNAIVGGAKNLISGETMNFIGGGSGVDILNSEYSISVGGQNNDISGSDFSVIGGGKNNLISDSLESTIAGGTTNSITGYAKASIMGGADNVISGKGTEGGHESSASIAGGINNKIFSSNFSFIGAGGTNTIHGKDGGGIVAGFLNSLSGDRSLIGAGDNSFVSGDYAVSLGNFNRIHQGHDGAFVFSDSRITPVFSSGANTMVLEFKSGVYVNTDSGLYINGNAVLTGETPEGDTLQSVTTRGDTTTTNIISEKIVSGVTGLFSSKVGIRTTDPDYRLDIGGTESSTSNTIRMRQADGGTALRVGAGGGSNDVTLLRVDGNDSIAGSSGGTDSSNYGFSLKYMGGRLGNANSLSLFSDNQAAASQIEAVTILQDGNVGIGTTSPSEKLAVSGNILVTGAGSAGPHIKLAGPFCTWEIENQYAGGANNDMFRIRNTALGSDALVINRGNNRVGIGTTNPQSPLEVINDTSSYDGITLKSSAGNLTARIGAGDVANNARARFYNSSSQVAIQLHANTSNSSWINAGNVGIGISSPEKKFHVEGDSLFDGDVNVSGDIFIRRPAAVNYDTGKFFVNSSNQLQINHGTREALRATVNTATTIFGSNNNTFVEAGNSDIELKVNLGGQLKINTFFGDNDLAFSSHGGDKILSVHEDASANSFVLGSNSNVGIGLSNPAHKLVVSGDVGGTGDGGRITLNGTGYLLSGEAAEADTLQTVTDRGATSTNAINVSNIVTANEFNVGNQGKVNSTSANGLQLQATSTDKPIIFLTNVGGQTERMRIGPSGNVGIGTDSPAHHLEVTGSLRADSIVIGTDTVYEHSLNLHNDGTIRIGNAEMIDKVGNDLELYQGKLNIQSDGNVGIGTATPDDALTIVGTSADFSIRKADNSLAARIVQFSAGGGQLRLYDTGSNETIRLAGDGTNSFINGNLGIGKTDPSKPLQVVGGISGEDIILDGGNSSDMAIQFAGSNNGIYCDPLSQMRFAVDSASSAMVLSSNNIQFGAGGNSKLTWSTNNYLEFNGGGTKARLNSVGLGVGTTDPTEKLDVRGDAFISGDVSGTGDGGRITLNGTGYLLSGEAAEADTLQTVTDRGATTTNSITINDDLIVDTDTLFVDASTDRVGINTNSLTTYDFEVQNGAGGSSNLGIIGGSSSSLVLNTTDTSIVTVPAAQMFLRATNGFYFQSGVTTRAVLTKEGDFGIGTASPSDKLHVEDDGGTVTIGSPTTSYGGIGFEDTALTAANSALFGLASSTILGVKAGGAIEMKIANNSSLGLLKMEQDKLHYTNGKFGIGTADPDYRLDIGGTGSSTSNTIRMTQNGGTAIRVGAGGGSNDVTLLRVDTSNGGTDSAAHGFSLKYMGSRVANQNGLSIFSDNQIGTAVEAVTVIQDGSVGIGTSSPSGKLDINTSLSSSATLNMFQSVVTSYPSNTNLKGAFIELTDDSNAGACNVFGIDVDVSHAKNHGSNRIYGVHSVLDGTAANNQYAGYFQAPTAAGYLGDHGDSAVVLINGKRGDGGTVGDILRVEDGDVEKFTIVGGGNVHISGNVGIRTTNPSAELQVNGDVRVQGSTSRLDLDAGAKIVGQYYENGEAELTFLRMYNPSDASINIGAKHSLGYISFEVDNGSYTERMRIKNDGNVGIGTTNPAHHLEVTGSLRADSIVIGTDTVYEHSLNLHNDGTIRIGNAEMIDKVGNDLELYQGKLYIQSDGNVGIGTTLPDSKLHIANGALTLTKGQYVKWDDGGVGRFIMRLRSDNDFELRNPVGDLLLQHDVAHNVGIGLSNPAHKLVVSGDVGGTGDGGRITLNGTGYLLSGEAAEADTLQSVTDRGNVTTNSVRVEGQLQVGPNDQTSNGELLIRGKEANIILRGLEGSDKGHTIREDAGTLTFSANTTLSGTDGVNRFNIQTGASFFTERFGVQGNGVEPKFYLASIGGGAHNKATYLYNPTNSADFRIALDGSHANSTGDIGTDAFTIQSSTRNVGIGTTNPAFTNGGGLEIERASAATLRIQLSDGMTDAGELFMDSNGFHLNDLSHGVLTLGTSNTERLRINSAGNVGIGTTNPSENLEVAPDSDVSAIIGHAHIGNIGSAGNAGFAHIDMAASDDFALLQTAAGKTTLNSEAGQGLNFNVGNVRAGGFAGSSDFFVDTDTLYVDASESHVGIGTTSPSCKLHVVDGTSEGKIIIENETLALLQLKQPTSNKTFNVELGRTDGDLTFRSTAERMRITESGNVGIGTSSPSEFLHILGEDPRILIEDTTSSSHNSMIEFSSNGINPFLGTQSNQLKLEYGSYTFKLFRDNGTHVATFDGDGNVGIGTTDPNEKLELGAGGKIGLKDSAGTYDSVIFNDGTTFKVADGSGSYHVDKINLLGLLDLGVGHTIKGIDNSIIANQDILAPHTGSFGFRTYGSTNQYDAISSQFIDNNNNALSFNVKSGGTTSEAIRIDKDGNVGIGTTDPDTKLHLHSGRLTIAGNGSEAIKVTNSNTVNFDLSTVRADLFRASAISDQLEFRGGSNRTRFLNSDGGTELFTITDAGNVGIGTTNPDFQLEVVADNTAGVMSVRNGANARDTFRSENAAGTRTLSIGNDTNGHGLFLVRGAGGTSTCQIAGNGDTFFDTDTLYIDHSENRVGIGTTNPQSPLEVINDSSDDGIILKDDGFGLVTIIGSDGTHNARTRFYNGAHSLVAEINANGGSPTYFNAGDFGIGLTNPSETLVTSGGNASFHGTAEGYVKALKQRANTSDYDGVSSSILALNNYYATQEYGLFATNNNNFRIQRSGEGRYLELAQYDFTFSGLRAVFNIANQAPTNLAINLRNESSDEVGFYSPATNKIGFVTDRTERMRIDDVGTIGMGTDSPSINGAKTTLHINGDTNGAAIRLSQASNSSLIRYDNTNGLQVGTIASKNLSFETADTTAITIDTSQRVGIGTNSPAEELHVDGNILIPQGKTLKGYYAGSLPFDIIGMSTTTDTIIYGGNNNSSDIFFDTHNGGVTGTRMTILNAGNVGIGTTAPSEKLTISGGNILVTGRAAGDDGPQIKLAGQHTTWQIENQYVNGATNNMFRIRNTALASDSLVIHRSNNNVGIGTTNPNSNLHVYAASSAPEFRISRASNGQVWVQSIDSSARFQLKEAASEGGTQHLRFQIDDAGETLLAPNAGNVGVGTASNPPNDLSIFSNDSDSATVSIHATNNDANGAVLRLVEGTNHQGGFLQYDASANKFNIGVHEGNDTTSANDTGVITIDRETANVGIGVTNPSSKFEVADEKGADGVVTVADTASVAAGVGGEIDFEGVYQGTTRTVFGSIEAKKTNSTAGDYGAGLALSTRVNGGGGLTERLTILEGGNVGIGTTNPSTTLEVAGTIKSAVYVIGSLPSASPAGQRAFVSNSTVGVGSTSVGVGVTAYAGGSNTIPVYSDGSTWRIG